MLKEFYAVTMTSVYRALIDGSMGSPALTKIAARDRSRVVIGGKINNGSMLSVGMYLKLFIPEGGGTTSFKREIGLVNTKYWGGGTSAVVALFLTKEDALACNEAQEHRPCDPRWRKETVDVLRAIGKNHPYCSISTSPECQLMDPKEWQ